MSLFKKLKRIGKKVTKPFKPLLPGLAASGIPGVSQAAQFGTAAIQAKARFKAATAPYRATLAPRSQRAFPALQTVETGVQSMSLFGAAGALVRGAGSVARRVPRPTVGGVVTAAGTAAILYDQFGNPVKRKRPRSKGITATQLKAFTRVTGILNKYCKVPPPAQRRGAPRRSKSCR